MINVMIKDDNIYYRTGLEATIKEVFWSHFCKDVLFHYDFTRENIQQADVIIMHICNGDVFTCVPELKASMKAVIIGISDHFRLGGEELPGCFKNMFFLQRSSPLKKVRETLVQAWTEHCRFPMLSVRKNCLVCNHRKLSPTQAFIVAKLFQGNSITQIASSLNVSDKTIYSHKHALMQKFSLRNDYELCTFLNSQITRRSMFNDIEIYFD